MMWLMRLVEAVVMFGLVAWLGFGEYQAGYLAGLKAARRSRAAARRAPAQR